MIPIPEDANAFISDQIQVFDKNVDSGKYNVTEKLTENKSVMIIVDNSEEIKLQVETSETTNTDKETEGTAGTRAR